MTQSFTYIGETELYYSSLGILATPGLIADFETPPADGFWEPTPEANTYTPEGLDD